VIDAWLEVLERRHMANLTSAELTRALRALSSCYVERRGKLTGGAALEGAGKRAAFALYYGPLHFVTVREIVRALGADANPPETIVDLGCGTGVAGAAWALACGRRARVVGVDRNAWAAAEAASTYRELGITGTTTTSDAASFRISVSPSTAVVAAYAINELDANVRDRMLASIVAALRAGSRALIVEAIAIRDKPWWPEWARVLTAEGARADEWRFDVSIPDALRERARRAGLTRQELTARTIARL
jgi:SAM-dependent methyltransferase